MSLWLAGPVAADAPNEPVLFTLIGGRTERIDDYRGRVLVLNFWATWCVPCRAELAELDAYVAAHPDTVAAVAVLAERRPDMRLVAARVATLRIPVATRIVGGFPLANSAVPTTYILDASGRVVLRKSGAFASGELRARLDALIARLGPAGRGG